MNRPIRPGTVAPPNANYELAVASPAGSAMLHTAGIVGFEVDGSMRPTIGEQAARVWEIIDALLLEAGFDRSDIVSYTTYVVAGEDLDTVMRVRDDFFGDHRAASTLVTVPQLADPAWKVEVSAVAARQA